jgi:hypothetical protein
MRLRLFGFPSPEDRFEKWIAQRHQERVLRGDTTASGPHPDEAFLKALAKRSPQIALDDPRVSHAANCPNCARQLFALREHVRSRRIKFGSAFAVVTCLLAVALFVGLNRQGALSDQKSTGEAAVFESLDLSNSGTFRGDQPTPLQAVSLPAALIKVTITLPRYSSPGQYVVAVARERTGGDLVAKASGTALANGDRTEVSVNLDLRQSKPGAYFLSTTHEREEASYYYPLQIK